MEVNKNNWNQDPEWLRYIQTLEPVIESIAKKFCWYDDAMREDTMQEARMWLLQTGFQRINGYEDYKAGRIPELEWKERVSSYCRMLIRNRVATYLKRNNWYYKRTKKVVDPETGKKVSVQSPEMFIRLDDILHTGAIQIGEDGEISPENWHGNYDEIDLNLYDENE